MYVCMYVCVYVCMYVCNCVQVVINGIKRFPNIQEYDTIQFTTIQISQPFILHLDEGLYCRVIWEESRLKFLKHGVFG